MEDVFVDRTIDLLLGIVLVGVIVQGIVLEKKIERLERRIKQLKDE